MRPKGSKSPSTSVLRISSDEFAERFNRLRSSEDRYRYLIQLGRKLEPYPEEFRDQEHLVPGCLSQVWLVTIEGSDPSEVVFRADSDAHIVKGLIGILLMMYSGKTAEYIMRIPHNTSRGHERDRVG